MLTSAVIGRGATVTVETAGYASFNPTVANVRAGDTVHWVNSTAGYHTVASNDGLFFSGDPPFFDFSYTFTNAGTYQYFCTVHRFVAGMTGSVVVLPFTLPPTVTITSPSDDVVLLAPATFTTTAEAADPDGTVARVEFFLDGTLILAQTEGPFAALLTNVPSGHHLLTTVATDDLDAKATNEIDIMVDYPPTVSIASPAAQSVFAISNTVTFRATTADADGFVTEVEFFADGVSQGVSGGPVFEKSLSGLTNGTHVLTAVARDDLSLFTTSAPVVIVIGSPRLGGLVRSPGAFQLTVSGLVTGRSNWLQASTTLNDWTTIATNVSTSAPFILHDPQATNAYRFYRVIEPP